MIGRITSDLASFKSLEFKRGLNILLADKSEGATDRQTRNGAGKTSLVELIHFLLGANVDRKSIFKADALAEHAFDVTFSLGGTEVTASRMGAKPTRLRLLGDPSAWPITPRVNPQTGFLELTNDEWKSVLGTIWFGLPAGAEGEAAGRFSPTFRSLFSYFARRQQSGGFQKPNRHSIDQQLWDEQVALSYLLGLDWSNSQRLQEHRQPSCGKLLAAATSVHSLRKLRSCERSWRWPRRKLRNSARTLMPSGSSLSIESLSARLPP